MGLIYQAYYDYYLSIAMDRPDIKELAHLYADQYERWWQEDLQRIPGLRKAIEASKN